MIFVFGSNLDGIHGAGATKFARQYRGAQWGVGHGLTGMSYALPTKGHNLSDMSLPEIESYVQIFCQFARDTPHLSYELTPVGTGLAGWPKADIWQLFKIHKIPSNVYLSSTWVTD